MARVVVDGVGIHYEVEGRGSPLVLQHGFTDSLVTWYEYGYVDALASDHQLVLIDARAHGESDKPHDASKYGDSALALDVVVVLDQLKIERSAFFGHSMGGLIGLALAHYAPARFTALGIGGAAPDVSSSLVIPSEVVEGFLPLLEQGPAELLTAWQAMGELSPELTERILAIDCAAMIACLKGRRERNVRDTDALARFPGRYRFFMGENDLFWRERSAALDRLEPGSLVTYAGLNHLGYLQRSDLVVADLRAFFDNGR
jgi:pimeloyl-ACP methyl ester carboxylesterase